MKKRNLIVAVLCSMCLAVSTPIPAMADGTKVVTLGADLTTDQKNTMMNYFKADSNEVQIITVTNQDERDLLGNYVPSEQIGTRTLSCAYVKPTTSGGIKVRTANLNYVTCNMIASALSTAGVTNCEVVAACPYEVSGTGALTGVMKAYESASGTNLDSTKKDLAAQEVVVTGNVGEQVGQDNATNIINQAKMQIIANNVQDADEIYNIVNNIAVQNGTSLTEDELNTIVSLLQQIAQQSYDISEMKQTLENIQQNLEETKAKENGDPTPTPISSDVADEGSGSDDITQDVNTDALGDGVKETSTEDSGLAEETGADTNAGSTNDSSDDSTDDSSEIPEATEDGTVNEGTSDDSNIQTTDDSTDSTTDDSTGIPEATDDEGNTADDTSSESTDESTTETEGTETTDTSSEATEDTLNTDTLTTEGKAKYDQVKIFCDGEYKDDLATLQSVIPSMTELPVTIDTEVGSKLATKVLSNYIDVLNDAGASYTATDTDKYVSAELNDLAAKLKTVFSIDTEPATDDILANVSTEDRQKLYDDTMKFVASLYGETSYDDTSDESASEETTEERAEENTEYSETEETY